MRISTSQIQLSSVRNILDQQSKLVNIQNKISIGKNIIKPSDDPAGAARILDLKETIGINDQYKRNADAVEARLITEESALTSMVNVFQRARELYIQGVNATLSQRDRGLVATELRENLSELVALAGTKDANGDYLFSGYSIGQAPVNDDGAGNYTYAGDQGDRLVKIGPNRNLADSDNGFDLFFDVDNTTENAFSLIYNLAAGLDANTQDSNNINDIDAILDNINGARSEIGSRLNAVDSQRGINEDIVFQSQQLLSSIEDLDLADAITELNLRSTALEAAQQSYVRVQGLSLFNFL